MVLPLLAGMGTLGKIGTAVGAIGIGSSIVDLVQELFKKEMSPEERQAKIAYLEGQHRNALKTLMGQGMSLEEANQQLQAEFQSALDGVDQEVEESKPDIAGRLADVGVSTALAAVPFGAGKAIGAFKKAREAKKLLSMTPSQQALSQIGPGGPY